MQSVAATADFTGSGDAPATTGLIDTGVAPQ
jgi:hypothetical protein